jgi:hypothetical protein
MTGRLRAWNRSLDDPIDLRALAMLRIALGPIVLVHLRPFLTDALDGIIYRDRFSLPFWEWYPELPRSAYLGLLFITAASAVAMAAGWRTRWTTWITAGGVAYNVFLSQTHFHHNRAFLIILLVGVAVLPTGNTVSVDAVRARRSGRPLPGTGGSRLALTVLRLEVATVYAASGVSKLLDPDWWGGTVTRLRVDRHRGRLSDAGLPDSLIDLLTDPGFQAVAAKIIVLTEVFIAIALLVRSTRRSAIWVAIGFHVAIQFTAAVQVFSLAALAALAIWSERPARDRTVHASATWLGVIRMLDWTGRFGRERSPGPIRVTDGGSVLQGRQAVLEVLGLLPLTFWFAAPLRLVAR